MSIRIEVKDGDRRPGRNFAAYEVDLGYRDELRCVKGKVGSLA